MATTNIEVGVYKQLQHPAPLQRPANPEPRPPDDSIIGISVVTELVYEGDLAKFRISRDIAPQVCSVNCYVSADVSDVLVSFSQTVSFAIGELTKEISIGTNAPPGVQGIRTAQVSIQTPIGCVLDPTKVMAQVSVNDLPGYANGYARSRLIVIPADAVKTTSDITDYMLMVWEVGTWLKQTSAGGRIQHANAWDIRFELADGTVLDIDPNFYYNATAGELVVDVRVPIVSRTNPTFVIMYYGKSDILANPGKTSAWRNYLAVIDGLTGFDKTGNGRGVTVTGVTAVQLIGSAGDYGTSGKGESATATWADGLAGITVEALYDPEADYDGTIINAGPLTATGTSGLGVYLGMEDPSEVGGAANSVVFKVQVQPASGSSVASRVDGPANSAL